MTAFVILAAGRGTRIGRVGEALHKALVPLDGRAVISHLFGLAPKDARLIVCLGHRAEQIMEYVRMAHPSLDVTFIDVIGWDRPGGGPGWSLLSAMKEVGDDDMVFTSCDTLWHREPHLWSGQTSWAGVAPVPAGTAPARWCRMIPTDGSIVIADKTPEPAGGFAYVGLGRIVRDDLARFWDGLQHGSPRQGELQVSAGFEEIDFECRFISWTDVGDADAYSRAVSLVSGYDWTKLDEATYLLPDEGRVVKFWAAPGVAQQRAYRASLLNGTTPDIVEVSQSMMAMQFIRGSTLYDIADPELVPKLLRWAERNLWRTIWLSKQEAYDVSMKHYRDKTLERVAMLDPVFRPRAEDAVSRIDWEDLVDGVKPVRFHGDFNFGNLMLSLDGDFVGVDWRGDFGGQSEWGDMRYDLGKLLAGTRVHWDNARRGNFRPWYEGHLFERDVLKYCNGERERREIQTIAALSLLNSAPLHASPLDEILVSRGTAWLEEIR